MQHGNITWIAAEQYGIKRLAARIPEIRERGFEISSKLVFHGREVKFARYTLVKIKNAEALMSSK